MLFFISNAVEGQLISTGAFEVSYNGNEGKNEGLHAQTIFSTDQPVWSKLETGRVPQPAEMVQIIESQLRLSSGKMGDRGDDFDSLNL